MQFIFFLTCCAIGAYGTPEVMLTSSEWISYKSQHNKNYENVAEELFRLKMYMKNRRLVNEHNAKFAKGQALFSINLNRFADVVVMDGLDQSLVSKWRTKQYYSNSNKPLPESVDWRDKGAVTPAQNQGLCGSCWSFSAVGAIEGQLARKTGKLIPLSVQSLIDCSRNNRGCLGGVMNQAFAHINATGGIVDEKSYPYVAEDGACRFNASNVVAKVKGYYDIRKGNDDDLKDALANVGPVSIGIDARSPLLKLYEKGIFSPSYCSSYSINHGALAVGYGVENGVEYWLIKNSWGPNWGENGYFKLLKNGRNKCGVSVLASFPVVSLPGED